MPQTSAAHIAKQDLRNNGYLNAPVRKENANLDLYVAAEAAGLGTGAATAFGRNETSDDERTIFLGYEDGSVLRLSYNMHQGYCVGYLYPTLKAEARGWK